MRITKQNNPLRNLVIITDRDISPCIKQLATAIRTDQLTAPTKAFPCIHRGKFWTATSARFLALNQYLHKTGIKRFIHLELDTIVSNTQDICIRLDDVSEGIFVPRDGLTRGIASFLYCNYPKALDTLLSSYQEPFYARNDMEALGHFLQTSHQGHSLPTESFEALEQQGIHFVSPHQIGFIFDAASIGQYCLGTDPIHEPYAPTTNMFVNEFNLVRWGDGYTVQFYPKEWVISILGNGENAHEFQLANLHCHCKNMSSATNLISQGSIYKRLLSGQRSVTAARHKVLSGIFFRIRDFTKKALKTCCTLFFQ